MKKHTVTICILDDDRNRCLREEAALDKALADKQIPATGLSSFGGNHLARSGMEGSFPVIDVDGVYFTSKTPNAELTYEMLCDFLEMLVRKGVFSASENTEKHAKGSKPQYIEAQSMAAQSINTQCPEAHCVGVS